MKTNEKTSCEKCGATLVADALGGFCPRCLMADAFDAGAPVKTDTARFVNPLFVRHLDGYELLGEIARGGMGVVYKARQTSLGRIVAVKGLSAGEFASQTFIQRFKSEAAAAARLRHPNIVVIHEVGEHVGVHYFSMDFVDGPNLADHVRQNPLAPERAASMLKAIAEAVDYAHQHGILHRDLKPSNVLIDPFGEPRITDFGLAKELKGSSELTATGQMVGTPGYMPPEQADASFGMVGPASDVYSLGAILYYLLTGRAPFVSGSLHDTLRQVLGSDPVPPRALNPAVPRDLDTICLKCLEKRPERRYLSAGELAAELKRFLAGEPTRARPVGLFELAWRWCRRHPATAAMAAVIPVILVIVSFGATATALYVLAARDAQTRATVRAEKTIDQLELQRSEDLLREGRVSSGLAYLADVMRKEPTNHVAATRIASVLMQRNFPLPACPPIRHGGVVNTVAFSPDGKLVASCGTDGLARIWRTDTGAPVAVPLRHGASIVSVGFTPDGARVWTASQDGAARVWDAATGRQIGPEMKHDSAVDMAILTPDGRNLFTASRKTLNLWDLDTGRPLRAPIPHGGGLSCMDISPDKRLLAAGDGAKVVVWDAGGGRVRFELAESSWVNNVDFTPDGKSILTCTYDGHARLWNLATRKPIYDVSHRHVISDAVLSPDGKRFATVSWDGDARVWDLKTGKPVLPPLPHGTALTEVAFSPDGQKLLVRGWGNTVWLWNVATGKPLAEPIQHDGRIETFQFSPDNRKIATGSADGVVMLWDIRPGGQIPLDFPDTTDTGSSFSADSKRLLTWGENGVARLWDSRTGKPLAPPMRHNGWIVVARFVGDGSRIATASLDGTAAMWDAATGTRLFTITGHQDGLDYMDVSRDGTKIATASRDGTARIWDGATGAPLTPSLRHDNRVWQVHFSPDGKLVVTASRDRTARYWDAATGQPATPPLRHEAEVAAASFDPGGKRVVTASMDMTARIWDVATGRELTPPLKHEANVRGAEFSPDGLRVVTTCGDGASRLWDAATGRSLCEPLQHRGEVVRARFSRDGDVVSDASYDGTARIWNGFTGQPMTEPLVRASWFIDVALSPNKRWLSAGQHANCTSIIEVPEMGAEPPEWLPDLAEAVACKRVGPAGFEFVSPDQLNKIRAKHGLKRTETWELFLRWFFADRGARTISPSSTVTFKQAVDLMIEAETEESLRDAAALTPDSMLPRLKLARMIASGELPAADERHPEEAIFRRWIQALPEGDWARAEAAEEKSPARALDAMKKAESTFAANAEYLEDRGRMAARAGALDDALADFQKARDLSPPGLSRTRSAFGLRNVLLRLHRAAEAATNALMPLTIPPRPADAPANEINLSGFFNALPDEPWHELGHPGNNLKHLPRGQIAMGDRVFDVRGVIQLSGSYIHFGAPGFPRAVDGIPVGRACRKLHFLHATGWGEYVPAGTVIGHYTIHYADGQTEEIPIADGEDLGEWQRVPGAKSVLKRARVVWEGPTDQGGTALLYEMTWTNPRPEKEIASFDFTSMETAAAPFLLAVSAE